MTTDGGDPADSSEAIDDRDEHVFRDDHELGRTSGDGLGLDHELDREIEELALLLPFSVDALAQPGRRAAARVDSARVDLAAGGPRFEERLRAINAWNRRIVAQQRIAADRWSLEIGRRSRGLLAPDFERIVRVLHAIPEVDRPNVRKKFESRYEAPLRRFLGRLSHRWTARWIARLRDVDLSIFDTAVESFVERTDVELTADVIAFALKQRRPDVALLERQFDALDLRTTQAVESSFETRHASRWGEKRLDPVIASRIAPESRAVLDAVRRGDHTSACVHRLLRVLEDSKPSLVAIAAELDGLTNDQRRMLLKHWNAEPAAARWSATPSDSSSARSLGHTGFVRSFLSAHLKGDVRAARVLQLRAAFSKSHDTWIGDAFVGVSLDARMQLVHDYYDATGRDFWKDLRRVHWSSTRAQIVENFVLHGRLSDADVLRDCLHGVGTDRRQIRAILIGATKKELHQLEETYSRYDGRDFITAWRFRPLRFWNHFTASIRESLATTETFKECFDRRTRVSRQLWLDLELALDGDDWFDLRLARRGRPSGPVERYERLLERVQYERLHIWNRIARLLNPEARALLRDVDRAREFYSEYQSVIERDISIDDRDIGTRQRLDTLVSFAEHTFEDFRESKHTITHIGSNIVAALVTAVLARLVFLTDASLPLVMATCGCASALTRFGSRRALTGSGYSRDRMAQDVMLATIDGVTFAAGSLARNLLGAVGARYLKGKVAEKAVRSTSSFVLKRLVAMGHSITGKRTSMVSRVDPEIAAAQQEIHRITERIELRTAGD